MATCCVFVLFSADADGDSTTGVHHKTPVAAVKNDDDDDDDYKRVVSLSDRFVADD